MQFRQYQIEAAKTEAKPPPMDEPRMWRLTHVALGLTTETGEYTNAIKKRFTGKTDELDIDNIVEELGDLMWYIAIACNAIDVSLGQVMDANIAKLAQRHKNAEGGGFDTSQNDEANRDRKAESDAMKGKAPVENLADQSEDEPESV